MTLAFRLASVQLAILSIGFGIPAVMGALHTARTGDVWLLFDMPTYDPAGFERWGLHVEAIPSMLAFLAACILGVIASILLWIPSKVVVGSVLAFIATAAQAVFWSGFVLPFGPPGGAIVIVLLVIGHVLARRERRRSAISVPQDDAGSHS